MNQPLLRGRSHRTLLRLVAVASLGLPLAAWAQAPVPPQTPPPTGPTAPPPAYPQSPPPGYPPPGYPPPGYPPPGYPPSGYPPPGAYYGQPQPDPGRHRHDGFFLRFLVGPGYTTVRADLNPGDAKVSGGGYGLAFALGGALSRNFVLYGELVMSRSVEPEIDLEGFVTDSAADGESGLVGLGVGIAYYLTNNLYVSGTLAATQFNLTDEDGDEVADTRNGPGLSLSIGKEWWVSDNWGLGAALNTQLARMKDREPVIPGASTPVWKGLGVNAMFSATFN